MQGEKNLLKWHFKGDKVILLVVLLLSIFSVFVVYSTGGRAIVEHLRNLAISYVAIFLVYKLDYRWIGRLNFLVLWTALALLIVTFGSRSISVFGQSLQTFYVIGLCMLIYFSHGLAIELSTLGEISNRSAIKWLVMFFLFAAGIAISNMSTAIIFFVTGLSLFFVSKMNAKMLIGVVALVMIVVSVFSVVVVMDAKQGGNRNFGRMSTFVHRIEFYITKDNTNHYGDQMVLARSAIARGGLHPAGPGKGVIKNRLPENRSDYAFASLYEELGIVAGIFIVFLYIVFFYRSMVISRRANGPFSALLAFSIGLWLTLQAFVHIGVNCNLLPSTGQTLPYVSTGGMSLFVSGVSVGLLLNMSKHNNDDIERKRNNPTFVRRSK